MATYRALSDIDLGIRFPYVQQAPSSLMARVGISRTTGARHLV